MARSTALPEVEEPDRSAMGRVALETFSVILVLVIGSLDYHKVSLASLRTNFAAVRDPINVKSYQGSTLIGNSWLT
jgi:hypothetical protein